MIKNNFRRKKSKAKHVNKRTNNNNKNAFVQSFTRKIKVMTMAASKGMRIMMLCDGSKCFSVADKAK